MTRAEILREEIILDALGVLSSRLWLDAHPEDPHGAASCELADDVLDAALGRYAEAVAEGLVAKKARRLAIRAGLVTS